MAKGKSSAAQNAKLRRAVREGEQARLRLEQMRLSYSKETSDGSGST